MTVIVGIASPDGIVLGSDSRTTRIDGDRSRILSDSTQKVFAVAGGFGVATSGFAFIGRDTIAGVMDRFLAQVGDDFADGIDAFADALRGFFGDRFNEWLAAMGEEWDANIHGSAITFLVAGYDNSGVGHIRDVLIPGPHEGEYAANTISGATVWRGQTDVIRRLIKGVDLLEIAGPPLGKRMRERLDDLEYIALEPTTVQDALDYASFLIRTTIDMQRFSDGTFANPGLIPGCGGPLQLLVVDRNGAEWAQPPTRSARQDGTS